MSSVLDNPVWYALSERHQQLAMRYPGVNMYPSSYCPFVGFTDLAQLPSALDTYAEEADTFFVVGNKPIHSPRLMIQQELVCLQMVLARPMNVIPSHSISRLSPNHYPLLFSLVNLVQPGYFRPQTPEMGNYYGIFQDHELVAVTGERMQMNDYTEVSAVVTHPDYTGRGYAKQLIAHTTEHIFRQGKTPFLHVAETNIPAIRLYEKLGFQIRRKMSFWKLIRA
ncbi:MAG: GNAT family N-acetyltransferase [Bacteroidota bacterium]